MAILILGFFIQTWTKGYVDAFLVFILGFYVILRFGKVPEKYQSVRKAAFVGLCVYTAVLIIVVGLFRFFIVPHPMQDTLWTKILLDWDWVYFPFGKILMILYPYNLTELTTGYLSLPRAFIYDPIRDFLNILAYVAVGVGVGMIRKRGLGTEV